MHVYAVVYADVKLEAGVVTGIGHAFACKDSGYTGCASPCLLHQIRESSYSLPDSTGFCSGAE